MGVDKERARVNVLVLSILKAGELFQNEGLEVKISELWANLILFPEFRRITPHQLCEVIHNMEHKTKGDGGPLVIRTSASTMKVTQRGLDLLHECEDQLEKPKNN